jgi:hypothetical protein
VKLLKHKNLMLTADEIRSLQSRGQAGIVVAAPDAAADPRS